MLKQINRMMIVLAALFGSISVKAADESDLSIRIVGNGGSFLAPGQRRDIDVVVKNDGPDTALNVRVMTSEFLIFPIGEVWIEPPTEGVACPIQYTDFTTPSGQLFILALIRYPVIVPGAESICRVSVRVLGKGRDSFTARMGVTDITPDSTDPNNANNTASFLFTFREAIPLPVLSLTGLGLLAIGLWVLARTRFA